MILNCKRGPPGVYNEHVFVTQDDTDKFCPELNTTGGV